MQVLKLVSLAFIASAVASPLARRADANTVVADLQTVRDKANTLNSSVTAFQGGNSGFIQALQIQTQSTDLQNAINQTTTDANASAPFPDEDAVNIAGAVGNLSPDVIALLDNIKSKKAAFDSGFFPLSPIVLLSLKNQRQATSDLADAITAKVSDDLKPLAPSFTQPILDKFDEVIGYYSSGSSFPSFGSK